MDSFDVELMLGLENGHGGEDLFVYRRSEAGSSSDGIPEGSWSLVDAL